MPKLNPYLIENKVKTEEVRYLDEQKLPKIDFAYSQLPQGANVSYFFPEEPRNLTPEQQRIQDLIEAAYRGEAEALSEIASYGPGFWSWASKVVITTTAGIVLGPAAIPVGAAVWGTSKGLEKLAELDGDEDAKKVFGYIGDCGKGTLIGGGVGLAANHAGALLGMSEATSLGSNVASSAARRATTEYFVLDGVKIFADVERARILALGRHGVEIGGQIEFWTSKGFEGFQAIKHIFHKLDGVNYVSGCAICED